MKAFTGVVIVILVMLYGGLRYYHHNHAHGGHYTLNTEGDELDWCPNEMIDGHECFGRHCVYYSKYPK